MPKIINREKMKQKQLNREKDSIIDNLLKKNTDKDQRLQDLELIVADMIGGKNNEGLLRKIFKKNVQN